MIGGGYVVKTYPSIDPIAAPPPPRYNKCHFFFFFDIPRAYLRRYARYYV